MWAAVLFAALVAPGGSGKVFLTVDEALALAFPECQIERGTEALSEAELERARVLAGAPLDSRVARPYVARRAGVLVGTAYFDAHRVRTKNEVLLLVVAPDERLRRVEVLSFAEPIEYLPNAAFYAQFVGKGLAPAAEKRSLTLDQDLRRVAGATLSAQAAAEAARRTLAVHRVLAERAQARTAAR
jgi:hypothetical protein